VNSEEAPEVTGRNWPEVREVPAKVKLVFEYTRFTPTSAPRSVRACHQASPASGFTHGIPSNRPKPWSLEYTSPLYSTA